MHAMRCVATRRVALRYVVCALRCVVCALRCGAILFLFGHLRVLYRYFRVSRAEQQNRQGLRGFLLRDNVSGGETCYQAERKT